jgi:hypothetical protein
MKGFQSLSVATALLCALLGLVWLADARWLLDIWSVSHHDDETVRLVGRRNGALFIALAVMFAQARHAEPSPSRRALAAGMVTGCTLLACLGLFEWTQGRAGPSILLAVVTECGLAWAWRHIGATPT